ncbi:MAG: GTP cyclohydrolase II [Polyangiales bacterium]
MNTDDSTVQRVTDNVRTTPAGGRVELVASADLPSEFGRFRIFSFRNDVDGKEHVAIVRGEVRGGRGVPMRIHSECLTGDVLGSLRCDCRAQLHASLARIADEGVGVILYMRQEGRGIGLVNKIRAYALQEQGLDTVEANLALGFRDDEREYSVAAAMLELLGVESVRVMTNNPNKLRELEQLGIRVDGRIAHEMPSNPHNARYLGTKAARSGHMLRLVRTADGSAA